MPGGRLARAACCALILCAAGLWTGCGGKRPDEVGLGPLAACPPTPNCVSSLAPVDSRAWVAPILVTGDPDLAWAAAVEAVADEARTRIVASAPGAIHAEVKSALFRFVDDLELRLDASERRIDVRSASRVGRSDLGVNRRRVEALRAALVELGLVRTEPSAPLGAAPGSAGA